MFAAFATGGTPADQTLASTDVDLVTTPSGRIVETELDFGGVNFRTEYSDDGGKTWTESVGTTLADTDRPWLAADQTLAPWIETADLDVVQTGAWIRSDQRQLSLELEAFLDAGEPPVYFGFGSMRAPQDVSQAMIKAARAVGRRAIVSRGWAGVTLPDNEPDCLSIGEVNLQALFRRVAAVVHHGGAGTTTAAAQAGTPQVVVPQMYDQHYWAKRVHQLGIGTAHAPGAPTADSLTEALSHTVQPDVAARARAASHTAREFRPELQLHLLDRGRVIVKRVAGEKETNGFELFLQALRGKPGLHIRQLDGTASRRAAE